MKILSFPFSMYANSGGCRIIRRLYQGNESNITSLVVEESFLPPQKGIAKEVFIYASPSTRKWMRWYLRDGVTWLRQKAFKFLTVAHVHKAAKGIEYDVIHVINHGPFSAALCAPQFLSGKLLWVSFHDHYSTTLTPRQDADLLWNKANRRLVISDELGKKYQELFGNKPYEIITDGVDNDEIRDPYITPQSPFTVYFAGMFHYEYLPLVKVLADALDLLSKQGLSFKFILRGTHPVDFLQNRSFEVEYKPVLINDKILKDELDSASILYLPVRFTEPNFYLYSLSTKMVGYLGARGTILYHGPDDSATHNMLKLADAAVYCNTLNIDDMAAAITGLINNGKETSSNAKALARKKFDLVPIRHKFWQVNN